MNTELTTGNPMLDLKFNNDVCITEDIFEKIYEPYCVKQNELTGDRVKVLKFKFYEVKICKEYLIEYILKDNYGGNISFERIDADLELSQGNDDNKKNIYDAKNNVVDFTKLETYIYFDNSELLAKQRLAEAK